MNQWFDAIMTRLERLAVVRTRLIGLTLLRILLGLYAAHFLLADYTRRGFFWGPHGMLPYQDFLGEIQPGQFSLLSLSSASWYFELVFHLSALVVVAFAVCGGRALTVALAVVLWSFGIRDWEMLQGGDVLAKILVLFLVFTTTDAYLSPWARRRRQRLALSGQRPSLGTVLHNAAAFLIVFQVATVYFVAGLLKLQGARWLDGTAMYYIAHIPQYSFFAPFTALTSHGSVTTAVTYGTLVLEIAFPVIVMARRRLVREVGVISAEAMHVGIIVTMGLVRFGLIMIGADAVCLRDEDYRSLRRTVLAWWQRAGVGALYGRRAPVAVPALPSGPAPVRAPAPAASRTPVSEPQAAEGSASDQPASGAVADAGPDAAARLA
jgi:hypothetical protein